MIDILLIDIKDREVEVEISFADLGLVGVANVTNLPRRPNEAAES